LRAFFEPKVPKRIRLKSPKPKAQSPKPKAQSPKPKAQSPKPKAQSPKPKAQRKIYYLYPPQFQEMTDESISLNKYISSTGICSRREADKLIEAGRVRLNGEVAQKGNRVAEGDEVLLDGKPLHEKPAPLYLALHKPPGITCTTDTRDKDNIIHFVNHPQRIFPIGRLDKASTGLILMTNDGDIVNKILREENNHEKEYVVKVNKPLNTFLFKKNGRRRTYFRNRHQTLQGRTGQ
jgi:23S rRNA-/tRNA-specific pseudouridylate synthase